MHYLCHRAPTVRSSWASEDSLFQVLCCIRRPVYSIVTLQNPSLFIELSCFWIQPTIWSFNRNVRSKINEKYRYIDLFKRHNLREIFLIESIKSINSRCVNKRKTNTRIEVSSIWWPRVESWKSQAHLFKSTLTALSQSKTNLDTVI